jgi:hypothetical protein
MASVAGGDGAALPHVRRGKLLEQLFVSSRRDEWKAADGRRRMAGVADEPCVLVLSDGKSSDQVFTQEHPMDGTLVFPGVGCSHEKFAGWNARQVRRSRRGHGQA